MERCFYIPGQYSIIDRADDEGKGHYSGDNLEQIQARYPGALLIPFEDALKQCEAEQADCFEVGKAKKTTKAQFFEALECLPPKYWTSDKETESFQMSELTCGSITACYVRINTNYFCIDNHIGTSHRDLIKACGKVA